MNWLRSFHRVTNRMMDELVEAIVTRGSNVRFKRQLFDLRRREDDRGVYVRCEGRRDGKDCAAHLYPGRGDVFHADHVLPLSAGGADDAATNGQVLCQLCHGIKTGEIDAPKIAKGRRTRDRHFGLKDKRTGFKGWRNMRGEVVWRDKR